MARISGNGGGQNPRASKGIKGRMKSLKSGLKPSGIIKNNMSRRKSRQNGGSFVLSMIKGIIAFFAMLPLFLVLILLIMLIALFKAIVAFVRVILQEIFGWNNKPQWVTGAEFATLDDNGSYVAISHAFENVINTSYEAMKQRWNADMDAMCNANLVSSSGDEIYSTKQINASRDKEALKSKHITDYLFHFDDILIPDTSADDSRIFGNENTNAWGRAIDQYNALHTSKVKYTDVISLGLGHTSYINSGIPDNILVIMDKSTLWADTDPVTRDTFITEYSKRGVYTRYSDIYPDGPKYRDYKREHESEPAYDSNGKALATGKVVMQSNSISAKGEDGSALTLKKPEIIEHYLTGNEPYFDREMSTKALDDQLNGGAIDDMAYLISAYNMSCAELPITSSDSFFTRTFQSFQWDVTNRLSETVVTNFATFIQSIFDPLDSLLSHITNFFGGDLHEWDFYRYTANLELYPSCKRQVTTYVRYVMPTEDGKGRYFDHLGIQDGDLDDSEKDSKHFTALDKRWDNMYHSSEGSGSLIWTEKPVAVEYHYTSKLSVKDQWNNANTTPAITPSDSDNPVNIISERLIDKKTQTSYLTATKFYLNYFDIAAEALPTFITKSTIGNSQYIQNITPGKDADGYYWTIQPQEISGPNSRFEFAAPLDSDKKTKSNADIVIKDDQGGKLFTVSFNGTSGITGIKCEGSTNNYLSDKAPYMNAVSRVLSQAGTSSESWQNDTIYFVTADIEYITGVSNNTPSVETRKGVFMLITVDDPSIREPIVYNEMNRLTTNENGTIMGYILIPKDTSATGTATDIANKQSMKRNEWFNTFKNTVNYPVKLKSSNYNPSNPTVGYRDYVTLTGGFAYQLDPMQEMEGENKYSYHLANFDMSQRMTMDKTYHKYYMKAYAGPVNTDAIITLLFYSGGYKGDKGFFDSDNNYYEDTLKEFYTSEFTDENGKKTVMHIVVKDYYAEKFKEIGKEDTESLSRIWQAYNGVQLQPACASVIRKQYECGAFGSHETCDGSEHDPYWSGEGITYQDWANNSEIREKYSSASHISVKNTETGETYCKGCGAKAVQEKVDPDSEDSEEYDQQSAERGYAAYVELRTKHDENGEVTGYDYVTVEQKINENTDAMLHDIEAAKASDSGELKSLENYSFLSETNPTSFGNLNVDDLKDAWALTSYLVETYIYYKDSFSNMHLPAHDGDQTALCYWGVGKFELQGKDAYDFIKNYIQKDESAESVMKELWMQFAPGLDQSDPFFMKNETSWTSPNDIKFPGATQEVQNFDKSSQFTDAMSALLGHELGKKAQRAYISDRIYNTMKGIYDLVYKDSGTEVSIPNLIYLTVIAMNEDRNCGKTEDYDYTFFDADHIGYGVINWQLDGTYTASIDVPLTTLNLRYDWKRTVYLDSDAVVKEICNHFEIDETQYPN